MRSSCEASETKRRIFFSEAWRASKDCSTWVSMEFSDRAREPTSVEGGPGRTRWVRSPAAILPAVDSMERRGDRERRTSQWPTHPPAKTITTAAMEK